MAVVSTPSRYVSLADAAAELAVAKSTLRDVLRRGEIPYLKVGSGPRGPVRILRTDLEQWRTEHTRRGGRLDR